MRKAHTRRKERKMTSATNRQVVALKKFAKDKELSSGILKGVQFDELDKEEARELIAKCYEHINGNNQSFDDDHDEFRIQFSENYRNSDGSFGIAILTDEEVAEVRHAHSEHCDQIYKECVDIYPEDNDVQMAMFDKRADKVFTWLQQALQAKVRKARK